MHRPKQNSTGWRGAWRFVLALLTVLMLANTVTVHAMASDPAYTIAEMDSITAHPHDAQGDGHGGVHAEHSHESLALGVETDLVRAGLAVYRHLPAPLPNATTGAPPDRPPTA